MFTDNFKRTFDNSDLFLGLDENGQEVGIPTDRHAITIAGSRSGKGACVIIPNLLRWRENVLVIDPKGENAELTYEAREKMGQAVHVLDPFRSADVPDRIRASFNPLASIDLTSNRARADIADVANGLIVVHDPKHMEWTDGARNLLAGIIAYVIADAPPEHRNFASVRRVLMLPKEVEGEDMGLWDHAHDMANDDRMGGLIRSAGVTLITAMDSEKGMEKDFLGLAQRQTQWLDDEAIATCLADTTFQMSDLKTGDASVYLVLPADGEFLKTYGAFLRLFVKTALNAMGRQQKGKRCLFMLDEFFSLGKLDEILDAVGRMPSYGVHLWPFVQNISQLHQLYTENGTETFFANADLHQFFGNADPLTLKHISDRLGVKTADELELPSAPSAPMSSTGISAGRGISALGGKSKHRVTRVSAGLVGGLLSAGEGLTRSASQASHANKQQAYAHDMQRTMAEVGKPRFPPDEVARLIQQRPKEVAPHSINFVTSVGTILLKPAPYFADQKPPSTDEPASHRATKSRIGHLAITFIIAFMIPVGAGTVFSGRGGGDFIALGIVIAMIATAIDWKFKIWSK